MRIDRVLSESGISRSEARSLIKRGEVCVNGVTVSSFAYNCEPSADEIYIRGERFLYRKYRYIMLNKPAGYLSATEDKRDKTVLELVSGAERGFSLFPAGRLDKDTEGLLLLTNDGDFAHRVMSPRTEIVKEYYARVKNPVSESAAELFMSGIVLRDKTRYKSAGLTVLKSGTQSEVLVRISEGKFHQVKKMLQEIGNPVIYLKRIRIGRLCLDENLALGEHRDLTNREIELIFE